LAILFKKPDKAAVLALLAKVKKNNLIRERHTKDAINSLISSFDKHVQVCAAVEEQRSAQNHLF